MFHFKQFSVQHAQSLLKVGTDAVLLGALMEAIPDDERALDVGTGCGIIALMAAQRFPQLQIDALDPDEKSTEEAALNFEHSPFASRLHCYTQSFQEYQASTRYDLIFSNPPYFEVPHFERGNNLQDIGPGRKAAATQSTLTFSEFWNKVPALLKPDGSVWVILPTFMTDAFSDEAGNSGFHLQKRIDVQSKESKPPIRSVLCYNKKQSSVQVCNMVLYNADGSRHPQYHELTSDFYL